MPTFLRKLFEQYAKRLLTNKVRPSILEEGIMTIPNNKRVTLMAENLYKDFKKAGVPDNILKTENDIKVFHHKIAEMNNENVANRLGTFEDIFAPKKPAEVFDLKGNKIKNPNNIMGGEEMIDPNSELAKSIRMEAEAEKKLKKLNMSEEEIVLRGDRPYDTDAAIKARLDAGNKKGIASIKNKPLDPNDVLPDSVYNETPGAFTRRNTPGSKENLLQELKIAYEKDFNRLRGDETVEELQSILKDLNKNGEPFADGGRIGYKVGSKGKAVEGLLNLIRNKFGKKAATTADKLPIPPKTRDRNMFKAADDRFKDKRMLDEDEIAELDLDIGGLEYTNDFDGTVGSANKLRKERAKYIADMELEYKSIGGSKRAGGPKDAMAEAIENASPGYTGDLKYDANLLADDLAEKRFGKEFYDLDVYQQSSLYDEAYKALAENKRTFKEMQNLSKPEKTLQSMKEGKGINMSDPKIADEFARFMKETDPKGTKDIEEKIILESFDPKRTKGNADGGRIGLKLGAGKSFIEFLKSMGKTMNDKSPVKAYTDYLKSVKDRVKAGKEAEVAGEVIPVAATGALITNQVKKKLKAMNEEQKKEMEKKANGGRIGL